MAFKTSDRVKETTTTIGTGTLTLAGAATGFRAFSSVLANTDTAYYCVSTSSGAEWEVGLGTWGTGNLLTRTTVIASSNAGAAVSFSAGTKDVFLTAPASKFLQLDGNGNVNLPLRTAITIPAASNVSLFTQTVGGRMLPAFAGPSGIDSSLQPHLGRNKGAWWQPLGNSTTLPVTTGLVAPTGVGTATTRTVATTNILTRTKRLGYVSAATAAAFAGHYWVATGQQYSIGNGSGLGGFHYIGRFSTSDAAVVSGARAFIGWSNSVAAPTNVEPNTLTNCFGVAQLSTDATQWYMVYGGSAAQSAIALGTGLGAPTLVDTVFDLALFCPPNSNNTIYYAVTNLGSGVSVAGTLTGTAGTALPASTALLALRAWRTNNATLLAVGLDVCSHYIETDQ